MTDTTAVEQIIMAAEAHTDLNVFHIVVRIMENSAHTNTGKDAAARIIAICQREIQRQISAYDLAVKAIVCQERTP